MSWITVACYLLAGTIGALFLGVLVVLAVATWYFGLSLGELLGGLLLRVRLAPVWRPWASGQRPA